MADPEVVEIRTRTEERPQLSAVRALVGEGQVTVRIRVGDREIELPRSLVEALVAATESLEGGDAIAVLREEAEISPAQAAKLLGVSRQYVDRLVADEVLPARRLPDSSYRRIPVRAVLAHKKASDRKRAAIREIVDEATAAGLAY